MRVEILAVADETFPETTLPDISLFFSAMRLFRRAQAAREPAINEPAARREGVVSLGHMFRQNDGGDRLERKAISNVRP
jgi:hypothetical protein